MIYIEQPKAPLIIWAVLKDIRKAKIEFTPDIMLTLLKCTNHPTSIRDLLKEIPSGKEADFKEAILGMVDRRKHTDTNLETMRNIANIGGFSEEFENIHKRYKIIGQTYDKEELKNVYIADSDKHFEAKKDFSKYDVLICDFNGGVVFDSRFKLPKIVDASKTHRLYILGGEAVKYTNEIVVGKSLFVNNCSKFVRLDLANTHTVSMAYVPDYWRKMINGVNLDFVLLDNAKNVTGELDFSCVNKVMLTETNLKDVNSMKFKKDSFIILNKIDGKLPKDIDFSMCYKVQLEEVSLKGIEKVEFNNDAEVIWKKVSGMPKVLDFSKCKRVEFEKCDFGNCKEIIFQNQKQAKDAKIGASLSFRQLRKIKYLEEPQQNKNKFSIFDRLR